MDKQQFKTQLTKHIENYLEHYDITQTIALIRDYLDIVEFYEQKNQDPE